MTKKCTPPQHMKLGMGQGPYTTTVSDEPLVLQAYSLPDGASISVIRVESDPSRDACWHFEGPYIDPCTGAPAALSAASPSVTLMSAGTYSLEITGADPATVLEQSAVFCSPMVCDTALLMKAAGPPPADLTGLADAVTCLAQAQAQNAANEAALAALVAASDPATALTAILDSKPLCDALAAGITA